MKRSRGWSRRAVAVLSPLLAVLLLSCSLGSDHPERREFGLHAKRSGGSRGTTCPIRVLLEPFRADPLLDQVGFVMLTADGEYEPRTFDTFRSPPGALARRSSLAWLRDAELFDAVLEPDEAEAHDLVLQGRVQQLYADVSKFDGSPAAVVGIEFVVLRSQELEPMLQKQYGARTTAASSQGRDLAAAWSEALADVLAQLEGDLRRFLEADERCRVLVEAND